MSMSRSSGSRRVSTSSPKRSNTSVRKYSHKRVSLGGTIEQSAAETQVMIKFFALGTGSPVSILGAGAARARRNRRGVSPGRQCHERAAACRKCTTDGAEKTGRCHRRHVCVRPLPPSTNSRRLHLLGGMRTGTLTRLRAGWCARAASAARVARRADLVRVCVRTRAKPPCAEDPGIRRHLRHAHPRRSYGRIHGVARWCMLPAFLHASGSSVHQPQCAR